MTKPTSEAVLAAMVTSLSTALGLTVIAANPYFALPEVTPPAAALGYLEDDDTGTPTISTAQDDVKWRLTYYGANEQQLLNARDTVRAWVKSNYSLAVTGYSNIEIPKASLARHTPLTESTLERYALDAVLTTTY